MCGRLNIIDDPMVIGLCETLGITLWPNNAGQEKCMPDGRPLSHFFHRFVRAKNDLAIIREVKGRRTIQSAIWWLLLEPSETGFKPSKYTSFNTRFDKLNTPRSAGYSAFRESRCIVPVKGFGETQGTGPSAQYTDFSASQSEAIALGGLCREWVHQATGKITLSCSIITLAPHQKLQRYHSKSSPLILNQKDNTMDIWLDSSLTDVAVFNDLLHPALPQDLWATPINKPSTYHAIATSLLIKAD